MKLGSLQRGVWYEPSSRYPLLCRASRVDVPDSGGLAEGRPFQSTRTEAHDGATSRYVSLQLQLGCSYLDL